MAQIYLPVMTELFVAFVLVYLVALELDLTDAGLPSSLCVGRGTQKTGNTYFSV